MMTQESLREFTRFTRPTIGPSRPDLSPWPACRPLRNYIYRRPLLLLSPKADSHFTILQRVED